MKTRKDIYEIMDELKNIYDGKIVYRVEKILLEQMRKHQYFFNRKYSFLYNKRGRNITAPALDITL